MKEVNDKKLLRDIIEIGRIPLNEIKIGESLRDMSFLFKDIYEINGSISNWDVSRITDMNYMFRGSEINPDISKWDVSNVKDMSWMFANSEFNQDISNWNVSNVKDMTWMFFNSKFNQDISNWKLNNKVRLKEIFFSSKLEKENKIPLWYKKVLIKQKLS